MRAVRSFAPFALLLAVGCSSAPAPSALASRTAAEPSPVAPSAPEPAALNALDVGPAAKPLLDDALAASRANRDPFHAFAQIAAPPPPDTRPRKARRISVDQLKLVGLVTHT